MHAYVRRGTWFNNPGPTQWCQLRRESLSQPQNIMYDKRVVRGSNYSHMHMQAVSSHVCLYSVFSCICFHKKKSFQCVTEVEIGTGFSARSRPISKNPPQIPTKPDKKKISPDSRNSRFLPLAVLKLKLISVLAVTQIHTSTHSTFYFDININSLVLICSLFINNFQADF